MARRPAAASSVFINAPFDKAYERQFIAIVASTIAIGRTPRCVLEIPERGTGRLRRLLELIEGCDVSLHDLSRVGIPARFNMPFELGLACAVANLRERRPRHAFILLETKPYRLQKTLSDLNGFDPYIHNGTIAGTIDSVLDALRPRSGAPAPSAVFRFYRTLAVVANELTNNGRQTLFTRSRFLELVAVGIQRAAQAKLINP
jgi:hypothetical protein